MTRPSHSMRPSTGTRPVCLRPCSHAGRSALHRCPRPSDSFSSLGVPSLWAELSHPVTLFAWPRDGGQTFCLQDPRALSARGPCRGWTNRL